MDLFDNNALNMPMVALRGLVVFPNITLHFDVGRKKSISAVKTAMITKQDICDCEDFASIYHISFYTKGYVG